MHRRRKFGNASEKLAETFLQGLGYDILDRQYLTRLGELDLVARQGDEIVFVEVKARRSDTFGPPEASVTPNKIRKIALAAELYLRQKHLIDLPFRLDVVAIEYQVAPPKITHFVGVG